MSSGDQPGPRLVEAPPPEPAPGDDPNRNIVYDVLYEVSNLEAVAAIKWDIFSVEERLARALADDKNLAEKKPELHAELTLALQSFRASEAVASYKERFVQNEERLKLSELIRFVELAVTVREPLHEAWAKYLFFDYERLAAELESVDVEGLARRPRALLEGVRETGARRANAVIAFTERNARQVFRELPYRDWSRVIAWHEEKNRDLAHLVADARMLYLQAAAAKESATLARGLKQIAWAMLAFTALAALLSAASLLRR